MLFRSIITDNDLLEVDLKRNQLKADSIDLENGIKLSMRLLEQFIGATPGSVTIDGEMIGDEMPQFPENVYCDAATACMMTPRYQLLEKNIKAKELEKRIAVGNNLPSITVGAGYFYDHMLGENNGFAAVSVTATIPISGWWGGSYAIKRSKSAVRQARIERDDYGQLLRIGIDNAWDDLTSAYRKAAIAKESIESSAENLRINRAFYDAGTAPITDLLQAEALHRSSMDNFIEAVAQYHVSLTAYKVATAQID